MDLLSEEIRRLSLQLGHLARDDEDVGLLMTIQWNRLLYSFVGEG
jgi:hypothetical protein